MDIKLCLCGYGNLVLRRAVIGSAALNDIDLADPSLLVNHRIELWRYKHTLGVLHLGCLELFLQTGILFWLDLLEIRLVEVVAVVAHHERDGLAPLLFRLGQVLILLVGKLLAVLIPVGDVPVDDGHRLLALVDGGSCLMNLLEGGIYRHCIAISGSVELEEEVIMTRVMTTGEILRQPLVSSTTVNPAFLPFLAFHLLQARDHHLTEPFDGFLRHRLIISLISLLLSVLLFFVVFVFHDILFYGLADAQSLKRHSSTYVIYASAVSSFMSRSLVTHHA